MNAIIATYLAWWRLTETG